MKQKELYQYQELFEAVQMQQVFPDGKTFTDCTTQQPLEAINIKYQLHKHEPGFDLATFIKHNFAVPTPPQQHYTAQQESIKEHINNLWTILTRNADKQETDAYSSLIPLPFPYIVPGGRFGEIYYWDSYFTMLGLQATGRTALIQSMVDNFSFLIDHVGYIPNGNRTYFLGRSQPPFYSFMLQLLAETAGENTLVKYLPEMEKEYMFWMRGADVLTDNTAAHHVVRMNNGSILNRYWDEHNTPRPESYREDVELVQEAADKQTVYRHLRAGAESGWDFSCRWFKDPGDFASIHTTDIIPVDLNCLLLHLEETMQTAYTLTGNVAQANSFAEKAGKRKAAIQHYCWNESLQFYVDYDFVSGTQKTLPTIAAVFPLYVNLATKEQAAAVAHKIESAFLQPGGVTTTLEISGQQWDAPNGWAPLQWVTVTGLRNYGFHDLAREIAQRWIALNTKVYKRTGKLMEKYNVYNVALDAGGGEYPSQDGFGWTNGVLLKLMKMNGEQE